VADSTDYVSVVEVNRQYLAAGFPREPPGLHGILYAHERFQQRMGSFLSRQFERLGDSTLEDEPVTDGILRSLVARGLVWNDPEQARTIAARFADWENVDPDFAGAVAMAYARTGGAAEHANLLSALDQAPDEATSFRLEAALPTFRDPELVSQTLDLLGTGRINKGHISNVIGWAAVNPEGRESVWTWMVDRSGPVLEQLRGTGVASGILEGTLPFIGIGREEEVRRHFAEHPWPEGDRGTRKGLELLRATSRLAALPP
ncbi:MAG: ERAP1-like C-terminal domain-containing protein, partial [Thermoplasmata archaeon]|nr:ERAP1-like C-terminal domain-containing protein [Thermoplasmata archaeon]